MKILTLTLAVLLCAHAADDRLSIPTAASSVSSVTVGTTISSGHSYSTCESISAASSGEWKSVDSAPRDGTSVEMLETYGIAPWYGLFRWTTDEAAFEINTGKVMHFKNRTPSWQAVDNPGHSVVEDNCLFWRPYHGSGSAYVDSTRGAQQSVAYWCAYLHRAYDAKKDACR